MVQVWGPYQRQGWRPTLLQRSSGGRWGPWAELKCSSWAPVCGWGEAGQGQKHRWAYSSTEPVREPNMGDTGTKVFWAQVRGWCGRTYTPTHGELEALTVWSPRLAALCHDWHFHCPLFHLSHCWWPFAAICFPPSGGSWDLLRLLQLVVTPADSTWKAMGTWTQSGAREGAALSRCIDFGKSSDLALCFRPLEKEQAIMRSHLNMFQSITYVLCKSVLYANLLFL